MALSANLSDKQLVDQGADLYQCSYTCTIVDELSNPILEETVSGAANRLNAEWKSIVAGQIATAVNGLLAKAADKITMDAKTAGLSDDVAALIGGV